MLGRYKHPLDNQNQFLCVCFLHLTLADPPAYRLTGSVKMTDDGESVSTIFTRSHCILQPHRMISFGFVLCIFGNDNHRDMSISVRPFV